MCWIALGSAGRSPQHGMGSRSTLHAVREARGQRRAGAALRLVAPDPARARRTRDLAVRRRQASALGGDGAIHCAAHIAGSSGAAPAAGPGVVAATLAHGPGPRRALAAGAWR